MRPAAWNGVTETILLVEDEHLGTKSTPIIARRVRILRNNCCQRRQTRLWNSCNQGSIRLYTWRHYRQWSSKPATKNCSCTTGHKGHFHKRLTEDIWSKQWMIDEGLHFLAKPFLRQNWKPRSESACRIKQGLSDKSSAGYIWHIWAFSPAYLLILEIRSDISIGFFIIVKCLPSL